MKQLQRASSSRIPGKQRLVTLTLLLLLVTAFSLMIPSVSARLLPPNLSALPTTYFYTGSQEASTAIPLGINYMLVADDEDQKLRLYDRRPAGDGVAYSQPDFTTALELTDTDSLGNIRSADIEGSVQVGSRIYWIGSHSNGGSNYKYRPNKRRLFATDPNGTGSSTTLTFVDHYDNLRTDTGGDLVEWGDSNGYNFSATIAEGVNPETINGFNIEGLTIAPDNATAYIAFRAPLVGLNSDKALIAPVANIAQLVTPGNVATASIGAPIELDLGGRGIRSIERNSNNEYVIIAGPPMASGLSASFQLYRWTGNPADAPVSLNVDMAALNSGGGSFEGIVEVPTSLCGAAPIQLVVDNGDQALGTFRTIEIANPCAPTGNTAPVVQISAPANGTTPIAGQSITFTASAIDTEDGDLSASLTWSSDKDGPLGSGANFNSSALSAGLHTITAQVTDSGGLSGSDQIGLTVLATPPGPAKFKTIFIILMENKEDTDIIGSSAAPYINSLTALYARSANYYGVTRPSFPNYLALTSGRTFGIRANCTITTCANPELAASDNIANQLEVAGHSWKAYMETMPSPCYQEPFFDSNKYAQKHNPFIYYDNIRNDPARCNKIVPFTEFAQDLQNNTLPEYVWITPDQVSDMHGIGAPGETFEGNIRNGDNWLKLWVPQILNSPDWKDNGLLIITFDEGRSKAGCCGTDPGGGKIVTLLISPLSRPGYTSATPYNHYSMLRTIQENWNLPLLNHATDPGVTPMHEFFFNNPLGVCSQCTISLPLVKR